MVGQPQKDTPFGLEPNLAAGLAYLLGVIGGIVMLAGGGTNRFVRWAACQAITLWVAYIAFWIALRIVSSLLFAMHLGALALFLIPVGMLVALAALVAWLWTWITAFQGREVQLPGIADLTRRFFAAQLG
ncbi:MAG: hypothetical protein KGN02_01595 [bacterium]|nr:hypothetical protein [bacterium]